MSGAWDRDLVLDLDAISDWGAAAVVTLLEPKELMLLVGVEGLGQEVSRRNMLWFHLPIVDVSIPSGKFEQTWDVAGEELRSILRRDLDVLVHCRGGLGRAGYDSGAAFGRTRHGAEESDRECARSAPGRDRDK